MRALLAFGITQTPPCLTLRDCAPRKEVGRTVTAAPTSGLSWRSSQLRPESTFSGSAGRRKRAERGQSVVVKAASTSTLLFLSALPFVIVGFVWVGVSLMIGRIEYDYYEELRELEEMEAERQGLDEQGLVSQESTVAGEALELSTTEEAAEPEPVGAGRRNRPIREE